MHLVFASSLVPCGTLESGFEIANAAIVDGLERAGAKVSHIGFQWPGSTLAVPERTKSLGELDVKTDTASTGQKLAWLAKAVGNRLPFASAKLRVVSRSGLRAALDDIGPYDAIVLNGVTLAGAFEDILTRKPYVFVAHNVEHQSAAEAAQQANSPVERFMYRREARHLRVLEARLVAGARHVWTLTQEDRAAFGLEASDRASVLPLVMPLSATTMQTTERVPPFDAGMIGTWTWTPNRIGLEWFLQEVMPHLPEQVTIAVAGALPAGFPKRDKRVTFLGRVVDAKQFIRQCRIVTLTARAGTGVQLKTIEAFEMGLPAVATRSSLRGIANVPANVRTADTGRDFARLLMEHIVDHRVGSVTDLDATAFRNAQIAGMDAAIKPALAAFSTGH
ncbi:MAG: glycosyltransferase [Roseitalea sp.]|jgi:hypothetical protein|nr:glycosyltransferase [Roseitalea sp.]MBO6722717.1 glycosyltransferase [Roseitalea sp.]MBO6744492.1 glycosyltransferase [Roseitalea sp.]